MKNRFIIFILVFLLSVPLGAHAQSFSFVGKEEYKIGETSRIQITLDSGGYFVNALEVYVAYTPETIEIVDISTEDSIVDVWVSPPYINDSGELVLIGGISGGAVVKDIPVVTLTIRTRVSGEAYFSVDTLASSVYANDGAGTPLSIDVSEKTFTISKEIYQPDINIESPTHPDEYAWYKNTTAIFAWENFESSLWSYAYGDSKDETVDIVPDTTTSEIHFDDVTDGVHYFLLRQGFGNGNWSQVTARRFQVDATPPETFEVSRIIDTDVYGKDPVLVFSTTDRTSGIARYVIEDDRETYEVARGPAVLRNPESTFVRVTAYDRAGNTQSTTFLVNSNRSFVWIVFVVLVALLLCVWFFVNRRYRKNTHS